MKTWKAILVSFLCAAGAWAGFSHPIEDSGELAQEIHNTPEAPTERVVEKPKAAAVHAVSLPTHRHISVPKAETFHYDLKGMKNEEKLAFSRKAREMKLPEAEYTKEVRAEAVASRYADVLKAQPFHSVRSPYHVELREPVEYQANPLLIPFENRAKRIEALFAGLDQRYPAAVQALWELEKSKRNFRGLRARDALFAGLLAARAGWNTSARNLYLDAAELKIARQERYLRIFWNELESLPENYVQDVVSHLQLRHVQAVADLRGDKANLVLAKLTDAAFAVNAIISEPVADRYRVIQALRALRDPKANRQDAEKNLENLTASTNQEVAQEALLALARAKMQDGAALESLDDYHRVKKDGHNRLELLSEQAYAEYKAGLHQDSLGKTLGLESPYFLYGYAPDVHLIEVLNRKSLCDFGGAEEGLARFRERYTPELQALTALVNRKPDPQAFYSELIGFHELQQPLRFQRYLLHLAVVGENQRVLNEAEADLAALEKVGQKKYSVRPEGWGSFLADQREAWEKRARELRKESAFTAMNEAAYLLKRLQNDFGQAELLALDVGSNAAKDYNLQSAMNFPVRRPAGEKLASDRFHWSFDQEIWEDELDFLKAKNPAKCAAVAKSP